MRIHFVFFFVCLINCRFSLLLPHQIKMHHFEVNTGKLADDISSLSLSFPLLFTLSLFLPLSPSPSHFLFAWKHWNIKTADDTATAVTSAFLTSGSPKCQVKITHRQSYLIRSCKWSVAVRARILSTTNKGSFSEPLWVEHLCFSGHD